LWTYENRKKSKQLSNHILTFIAHYFTPLLSRTSILTSKKIALVPSLKPLFTITSLKYFHSVYISVKGQTWRIKWVTWLSCNEVYFPKPKDNFHTKYYCHVTILNQSFRRCPNLKDHFKRNQNYLQASWFWKGSQ